MEKKDIYKYIFIIAAIWNCFISSLLVLLAFIENYTDIELLKYFGIIMPIRHPNLILFYLVFSGIFVLGLGYYRVSMDINKKQNQYIVIIGTIVNLLFFIITIVLYFLGNVLIVFVALGCVNLVFACVFIEFLLSQRKVT